MTERAVIGLSFDKESRVVIDPVIADLGRSVLHRSEAGVLYAGVVDGFDDNNVFVRFGESDDSMAIARTELNWPVNGEEALHIVFD